MAIKNNLIRNLFAIGLIIGLLLGFGGLIMPGAASATEISVTVTGDGVTTPTTFTQAQLEAMTQVEVQYSTINTWPTKKWYVARGVRLADLLTAAGVTADAKTITVRSTDGYNMTFTKEELLDDPRYYYPGLKENAEYDGSVPGSPDGAVPVDTILALANAGTNDIASLSSTTTSDAPIFMMGQRYVTEQSNNAFIKYVDTIEVTTATPAKWENPAANPVGGNVDAGTQVALSTSNMDGDNIHYTTDGSDPTLESPMYNWIKARWWSSREADLATINHPIDVNQSMTIKAIAIGFGKTDSDIVTFDYQVPVSVPALTADSTDNNVGQAVDITFTTDAATWEAAISGITVNGNALTDDQYTVTAGNINIAADVFPAAGDYTIVISSTGYSDATVTQTINIVASDPSDFTIDNGVLRGYLGAGGDVNIPDNLGITSIGEAAFQSCSSLTSISIPEGVTSIGTGAFWGCSSLTSVSIPSSVTSFGDSVFYDCSSLSSINIPNGVTIIGTTVFRNCSSLTSITIPGSVISIGNSAFYGCSSLTSITIPDSVTSIGETAFSDCSSLASIIIPDSVISIGNSALYGCSSLTSITIPGSVTSIVDYTFRDCTSLDSVSISEGVASIGISAFSGCSSLTSITIPDSIITIVGDTAFNDCTNLIAINVGSNNPNYTSEDGVLFNKEKTILVCYPVGKTGGYIVPESVRDISLKAFHNCSSLSSIIIPGSVTSIGEYAFYGCSSLTSVTIPSSVTSIAKYAFNGCSSLTSITIPDSVTSIGDSAFRNSSSLTSIIIPDSITSIGKYAFRDCSSLVSITIPDSVTSIGSSAFSGCTNLTIYGYAGSYTQTYAVDKSIPFKIVSPTLTLDMTGIIVGQAAVITFTDDEAWRAAITDITVNGTSIASQQYSINAGIISINASLFTGAGENTVAVKATGYQDAVVTQTINPLYRLSPQADEVYTVGTNGDGINTMTVNTGNTGLKYFAVGITPVISHNGNEAVVFTHLRNDAQISINITKADFYQATTAQAGFNVQAGDVVKVYIVDDLTNATDCNPILLQ